MPDPASRFQPQDLTGPSEGSTPAIRGRIRTGADALGTPPSSMSCTSARSHPKARSKRSSASCPTSAGLGVTAVQLMPIGDFPGRHNWGYDGVLLYAPDSTYAPPGEARNR